MGAALRTDPTLVRVGPLSEVHHCPLAAKIRKRLRRREVPVDITCVYSTELVEQPAEEDEPAQASADEVVQRGRARRPLGSLPTLTGIFGLTAANTALRLLLADAFPA
jgi:tRNA A37 threonylcarbamoyladenosine dehydratase